MEVASDENNGLKEAMGTGARSELEWEGRRGIEARGLNGLSLRLYRVIYSKHLTPRNKNAGR